jgi:hypothetical protein
MTDIKSKTRNYHLIGRAEGSVPGSERIINASSLAQALSHAAKTDWDASVLSVDNALRLAREGVETEQAGSGGDTQLSLPI